MEKKESETRDFISVESFSQLPFNRPMPLKEKSIRLFGKEFGGNQDLDDSVKTNAEKEVAENGDGESSRKFECHYCFRNFPTSQALGGHQNAHKRERQNAKRAAMVHDIYPQAHVYGMNYQRFGSGLVNSQYNTYNQYSWNSNSVAYDRFYSGYGSNNQPRTAPIHGSPLSLWRIPSAHGVPRLNNDQFITTHSSPLYSNLEELHHSKNGSSSSQNRYVYQSNSLKDHVSLDLHL